MNAMYAAHFGLREGPFSLAPDPRYLYASEQHREALAHLLFGVGGDGGFVLLTGEVGTGKTTVFRSLLEQLPEGTRIAFVLHPRLSAAELLASVCDEFGISYPRNTKSTKKLVDRVNAFLLAEAEEGRRCVLVIDEAQNLDTEVLEQLRLLTNLETTRRKLLQVILIGQPELREKLARPGLRQLSQRITARFHLDPLGRREVGPYILHRLAVAGGEARLFPPRTIRRIAGLSRGVPRLINILCDRSLLGAFATGAPAVTTEIVSRAWKELSGERLRRRFEVRRPTLALAGLLAAVLGLAVALDRDPLHRAQTARPAGGGEGSLPVAAGRASLEAPAAPSPMPDGVAAKDLAWLFSQSRSGGREGAQKALLDLWGAGENGGAGADLCGVARKRGLECLRGKGSLEDLGRLNRPAVLRLLTFEGGDFHAALTALEDGKATLSFDGGSGRVSFRWYGEYTLLWRPPPGYRGALRPGLQSPVVPWLRRRIAVATGSAEDNGEGSVYDSALAGRVREFQKSRGLSEDGIVGPLTVIHLNTAADAGVPVLHRPSGES